MPNFTFAFNYRKVLIIYQQLSCFQVKEKNVFDVEEMKLMEFVSETSIFVSIICKFFSLEIMYNRTSRVCTCFEYFFL